MSAKSRGTAREHAVMKQFRERHFVVIRAAGSMGAIDFVALRVGLLPRLVQVKSDKAGPFAHFGPEERYLLNKSAVVAGGMPLLAWIPTPGKCTWYVGPEWREFSDREVFAKGLG